MYGLRTICLSGRWWLLCPILLVLCSFSVTIRAATVDSAAAPPGVPPITDKPFSSFSRDTAPRWFAVGLGEYPVLFSEGTHYVFSRLTVDVPFYTFKGRSAFSVGARLRSMGVFQTVPEEDRSVWGIGNLQGDLWLSWQVSRETWRLFVGSGLTGVVPLGQRMDLGVHSVFQYPDETVPMEGGGLFVNAYLQTSKVDAALTVATGVAPLNVFGNVTATGFYKFRPRMALMVGALYSVRIVSLLGGFSWHATPGLDLGAGIHLPIFSPELGQSYPVTFQPMLEARYVW